jgi:hypothetical protein
MRTPRVCTFAAVLVTAPVIARLAGYRRLWAWVQVKRGRFGPVRKRGRAFEVELASVEAALGMKFSAEQLRAAGISNPEEPNGPKA